MAWNPTPAQRRAYAIKKRKERERAAEAQGEEEGKKVLKGFKAAPSDHRCGPWDISGIIFEHTPIVGRRCNICGRTWSWQTNDAGYVTTAVKPLTKNAPPYTPRVPETKYVDVPSGALNELPPDNVTGAARGEWMGIYAEKRRQIILQTRAKLAS